MKILSVIALMIVILLTGCAHSSIGDGSFEAAICWRRMDMVRKCSVSYLLAESDDKHNWKTNAFDPQLLIKDGYIASNHIWITCPDAHHPYAPFPISEGPVCPQGHQGRQGERATLEEYNAWVYRYGRFGTAATLESGLRSTNVTERRICTYCAAGVVASTPEEKAHIQKVLLEFAHDTDYLVRCFAMENIDDNDALHEGMNDPVAVVRAAAIYRCAELKKIPLAPDLVPHLKDKDIRVRHACLSALERMTGKSFRSNTNQWKTYLIRALSQPSL